MYLKSLEISGFKSFAKKTTLEFNSPISGIVGPNGSGKSNVAEALRFVLGEQSIKSMRGKKGGDLIFNGSGDVPRANRASVKVTFDNRRKFLDIDFDEVTIERVVFRDSNNEYFINGNQVRLKDIIELLSSAHIGASGHHIISQGEADKILNSNPKERKSMVEDALGLKIYQYKKQESQRKLLKTEENIKSVESLRREIAPHIRFLKKQVEKIEKTNQMREELKDLYREYLKREKIYLNYHKEKTGKEKHIPEKKLSELQKELAGVKKTLSESKDKDQKSEKLISLEEKIREKRQEKDRLLVDLGRMEGEISSAKRILTKHQNSSEAEDGKKVSLKTVEELIRSVEEKIEKARASSDPEFIKSILEDIKKETRHFVSINKNQESEAKVSESQKEIEELLNNKAEAETKVQEVNREEKELDSEYRRLQEDIEESKDSKREAEREVFRLMAEESRVSSELSKMKDTEEKLRIEEEDFKRELGEAGVIVGKAVLSFENFQPTTDSGGALSLEEIANEERGAQEKRRKEIEKIKIRLEDSSISSSEDIMKEYRETAERDSFLERELEDLIKSADSLKNLIKELEEKLAKEFQEGVSKINKQFQEYFSLMFGGGTASIKVVKEETRRRKSDTDLEGLDQEDFSPEESEADDDSQDREEGVEIKVSLPRKKIKGLMMLSGGERALTSIALIFAVSQVNPPPFLVLDETDAALDEANSKKYGDMIENLSKHSQLILITHNRETMSRVGVLYGVTMGSGGVSKMLSVAFEEAVEVAK